MARQRVVVTWKKKELANIVSDFDTFLSGDMTQTTLRQKYHGRTLGALKNKYGRVKSGNPTGYIKASAGRPGYTYAPVRISNGNGGKKIPNFLKGVASRLKAEKLSEDQINRVLFGSKASLTTQSIKQLEQLAGTEGSVNVRLFVDVNKVKFEVVSN